MAEPYGTEPLNAALAYIGEDIRALAFAATMAMEALDTDPHPGTMNVAVGKLLSLTRALIATSRYEPRDLKKIIDRLHTLKRGSTRMNRLPGTWMAKEEWDPNILTELDDISFQLYSLIAEEQLYNREGDKKGKKKDKLDGEGEI